MTNAARVRAHDRLAALSTARLPLPDVFDEAQEILARALPREASCWHSVDPASLVETRYSAERMPPPTVQVAEIAYLADDYNSFVELANGPRHSGLLSEATGGDPRRSLRFRELIEPAGMRGELRAAFVVDGVSWGCVSFFREGDFDADDRDFAELVGPLLGLCFRAAGIHARPTGPAADLWPGVITFDARRAVESYTPATANWLREFGFAGSPALDRLPFEVMTLVERVRGTAHETSARALGESGRWIRIHAAPATHERVTVVLQAAAVPSIAPLISAAYGLTPRERELTELVLQGCDTRAIAARMELSPYTVQSHLKSIFAKVGVRSRGELVGRING
ncbi:helix-turn-helix transcriptional regulator [Kribbella speibonae]|uniref:LuxR family transcriptional regulator n=1 Tax=Kribbella speibonae TaxID=1572660 RepID=A0A4R0JJ37_9ACTN|nr:LuxR family transcriptional regulator [Kribbella speibonae]TCC16685.1 LuxR family transcriptional regulator [Kribbella speibonae]TCC41795.1 LuxR family transcriptional regulator [Kribbella speibonae]